MTFRLKYQGYYVGALVSNVTRRMKFFVKSEGDELFEMTYPRKLHKDRVVMLVDQGNNSFLTLSMDKTLKRVTCKDIYV